MVNTDLTGRVQWVHTRLSTKPTQFHFPHRLTYEIRSYPQYKVLLWAWMFLDFGKQARLEAGCCK